MHLSIPVMSHLSFFTLGLWCLCEHRATFLNPCINKKKKNRVLVSDYDIFFAPVPMMFIVYHKNRVSFEFREKWDRWGHSPEESKQCLADMAEKDKDKTQSLCRFWRKMTSLLPPCLFCWCIMCGWGQDGMYTCHRIHFFLNFCR